MKKPHNYTNIGLGLAAFAGALWYAASHDLNVLVVGGFFAVWFVAEIFLNLLPDTKSGKDDADSIREKAAADAASKSAIGMGIGIRGGGMTPTMSPTANIQLDDQKKLIPITWAIILILFWWMPILVAENSGTPGPIQMFSEPLMLVAVAVLAVVDFVLARKKK